MMNDYELQNNLSYLFSIKPFKTMLSKGAITKDDFNKIESFLLKKYKPIFVSNYICKPLDNSQPQR